ncbi:MFS transporter [Actinospica sp.]|uniref:MFS transporter n=1 Tax=Actinospica sp. TaxID=1872142 RepID=UPI002C7E09B9|nr:MFS transporter [Actinospica sp.]HWG25584.1 MFS transporter [Actinospica sp.]
MKTDHTAIEATPRRTAALVVCVIGGFLTLLDVSIVTVALPSMEKSLRMTPAEVSWSLSGYSLAFGLALVPAGRLGDLFGRRRLLLIGILLFAVTGILCGAATSATMLIVARLARGAAAGIVAPQAIGLIQQMYSPKERGKAFGIYGAAVGISTAIGPLLGGLILNGFTGTDGWRYVFYLFVPIAALAFVLGLFILPQDRPRSENHSLDGLGALLLGAGMVFLMLPLIEASSSGSKPGWWRLPIGVVLVAAFFAWEYRLESRGGAPLLSPKLLAIRGYSVGTAIGLTFYAGFTGIFLSFALFFQQGLKLTPLHGAMDTIVFVITSAVMAIICGRIVHRFGQRMVVVGCLCTAVGLFLTALLIRHVTAGNAAADLFAPLLLAGFGAGMVITPNQTLTMHSVPRTDGGTAAGGFQTGQRIGTAIGAAVGGSLFFGRLTSSLSGGSKPAGGSSPGASGSTGGSFPGASGSGSTGGSFPGASGSAGGSFPGSANLHQAANLTASYQHAAQVSLFGSAGLIALAFVIALVDVLVRHRTSTAEETALVPSAQAGTV